MTNRGDPRVAHDRILRASEIGQYLYCARAWWLGSVEGRPSAHVQEMEAGEVAHHQHGRRVRTSAGLARLATLLLIIAVLVAIIALLQAI